MIPQSVAIAALSDGGFATAITGHSTDPWNTFNDPQTWVLTVPENFVALADHTLVGGTDNDVINADAGSQGLIGGDGNDTLAGGAGDDWLVGGTGNDTLSLGTGNDILIFATGDGFDIVTGFQAGLGSQDIIDLTGLIGIADFLDVQAAAALSGLDTVLTFLGGDGIRLLNVLPTELVADDFLFSVSTVNTPPVAGDDGTPLPIAGSEDGKLTILAGNLLANDSDADLDTLSLVAVGNAVGGTVGLNAQGNVEFTPIANYSGPASFTYTVADGQGGYDTAAVNLSFAAVADGVQLTADDVTITVIPGAGATLTGTSANNTLTGTSGNDTLHGLAGNDTLNGDPSTPAFGAQTTALGIGAVLGDLDGSETLSVTVGGVPAGAFLSAGINNGGGNWTLSAGNLAGLTITTPAGFTQAFSLSVTAVATDTGPGGPVTSAPVVASIDVSFALPPGSGGNDTLIGGAGNDVMNGGGGDDTFSIDGAGDGDDTFNGGLGFDRIVGSAGDDSIGIRGPFNAASSVEQIDGGAGVNSVRGTTGNDSLDFSTTTLLNIARIDGGAGGDVITGSTSADTIVGGGGNDTLRGGGGDDTFNILGAAEGDDTFFGDLGFDRILGGAGDDSIGIRGPFNAASSIEQIDGGAGTNSVRGTTAADTLDFSTTTLLNIARIDGGAGNDTVTGSTAADIIVGGIGNDTMRGGNGDDTFNIFGAAEGDDTFFGDLGIDRIVGGAGDDTIGIRGPFNAASSIEEINGGGGFNVVRGTTAADTLNFSATTLVNVAEIRGGAGDDLLTGSAGGDTFAVSGATDGFDTYNGGGGIDRIVGGADDDSIGMRGPFNAASSIEQIDGGAGFNILRGTTSADTLDFSVTTLLNIAEIRGGAGDDVLTGSAAGDTFAISGATDGFDTYSGGGGFDRIIGSAGDDAIGLKGTFNAARSIEQIEGGGGVDIVRGSTGADVLDFSATTLVNIARIEGGAGNDTVTGSGAADTIVGGSGTDILRGGGGDDIFTILGLAEGDDTFFGDLGFDRILGGVGDDTIGIKGPFNAASSIEEIDGGTGLNIVRGTTANDILDFSATVLTNIARVESGAGNDTVTGSAAADTILGGIGNDILRGGGSDDTFAFATGSGLDSVADFDIGDHLRFDGLSVANLTVLQQGANVVLQFAGETLSVTLQNTSAADLSYSMGSGSEENATVVRIDPNLI